MSAINVGEVYYFLKKHHNEALADSWRECSRTLPATIEAPSADDIWSAASLKARFPIAYADAFAAALAQKYGSVGTRLDRRWRGGQLSRSSQKQWNLAKATIQREQLQPVLERNGCDPHVVAWNGPALPSQIHIHLGVPQRGLFGYVQHANRWLTQELR
jgi:hypothetical protein